MIYEIYESIVESLMEIIKQISEHKKKSRQNGGPYNVSIPHRKGTTRGRVIMVRQIEGTLHVSIPRRKGTTAVFMLFFYL